eukprot:TRINITY_DN54_c0_g2_i2.p1 TRINITY_DN54_c0_g2~~TRINITY_DN54_c0_g2_i2.p1  ORF type:complete len:313 (+),score=70.07 TRINITY_DN54_c0_g2_i2:805-1743(+)
MLQEEETDGVVQISVRNDTQASSNQRFQTQAPSRSSPAPSANRKVEKTRATPVRTPARTPERPAKARTPVKKASENIRSTPVRNQEEQKRASKTPVKTRTPEKKTVSPPPARKSVVKPKPKPSPSPAVPAKPQQTKPKREAASAVRSERKKSPERSQKPPQPSSTQRPQKFVLSSSSEDILSQQDVASSLAPPDMARSQSFGKNDLSRADPNRVLPADVSFETSQIHEMHDSGRLQRPKDQPAIKIRIVETYPDGSTYEGESYEGLPHGVGKMSYPSGGWYEGQWELGVMDGQGQMYYPSGDLAERVSFTMT